MTAAAKKAGKAPVSTGAVIQRINRVLAKDGSQLRTTRSGTRAEEQIGRYYRVNSRNHVEDGFIDLKEMARELNVLKPWEELIES